MNKIDSRKQILFVGWVNQGKVPSDGESAKNQCILTELQKYCRVKVLDFYNKKAHPWIYLQAAWAFLSMPKATIIFSTSASNVYRYLRLFMKLGMQRNIIYWGIGGNFTSCIKKIWYGPGCEKVFNNIKFNLVECPGMVQELEEAGVHNGLYVPNFKQMDYLPDLESSLKKREENGLMKFVFLSRIREEKGCSDIFEAVRSLNEKGLESKFSIDFYGKVDLNYEYTFKEGLAKYENTHYKGILNLKENKGYDTLSSYDAMLFPTFWRGEGFAGIFIDAFIAGLPVIASDWAHNREAIEDGKTGFMFPVHDFRSLASLMEKSINGEFDLIPVSVNARAEAYKYRAENIITWDLLNNMNLV